MKNLIQQKLALFTIIVTALILFAGIVLKGEAVIILDNEPNQAVYKHNANQFLTGNSSDVTAPDYVSIVPQTLSRYSSRKGI